MSKRSNLTVTLIGVGIILAALAVILTSLFMPRRMARKEYNSRLRSLREAQTVDYVSIVDPTDQTDMFGRQDAEARVTDAKTAKEYAARLADVLTGARYGGEEDATSGNWDIRVRFDIDGDPVDFYLREADVYISRGSARFVYIPQDAAAYTALRGELTALLP